MKMKQIYEDTMESVNNTIEQVPTDVKVYTGFFIAGIIIFLLSFYLVLLNNKLDYEQSKPKSIEQIAKSNIARATAIKEKLEKDISKLELDIENKQTQLKQAERCLNNTTNEKVVKCYILK